MKQWIAFLFILICVSGLTGCDNVKAPDGDGASGSQDIQFPDRTEAVNIVDRTKSSDIGCDAALEKFYEDEAYEYYFPMVMSEYIIVEYADGSQKPVKEALTLGEVTIGDLDRFDIDYLAEPKNGPGGEAPADDPIPETSKVNTTEIIDIVGSFLIVDAQNYYIHCDSSEYSAYDSFAFEVENVQDYSIGDRVTIIHTGEFIEGSPPQGTLLGINKNN